MFKNFGLDAFIDDEEVFRGLVGLVCERGKCIRGYSDLPCINLEWEDIQFVARTKMGSEENTLNFEGIDLHMPGSTVWEFALSDINIRYKDRGPLSRRVVIKSVQDGKGMAVVNLLNADVLPSFMKNDVVKAQMVGFPELVHYYADEDAYAASQPKTEDGRTFLLADGTVMPNGLLMNNTLGKDEDDKDPQMDSYTLIRGTVQQVEVGRVAFEGEELSRFVKTTINTNYGDLEIVHTLDQVEEAERENIKKGAIVYGVFTLSGDVAIYDYNEGIVMDEEHHLSLLRHSLISGEADRLGSVLTDDSEYVSERSDSAKFIGKKEIIDRIKLVNKSYSDSEIFAYLGTIISVDEGDEELKYGIGKRCMVIAYDNPNEYNAITFVDVDENTGMITSIYASMNSRYHFKLDESPVPQISEDELDFPDNVADVVFGRAKFSFYLKEDFDVLENPIVSQNLKRNRAIANAMWKAYVSWEDISDEELRNAFGYIFARSIEHAYGEAFGKLTEEQKSLLDDYKIESMWANGYEPLLDDIGATLKEAYEFGKKFYKDYDFYCEITKEENIEEAFVESLIAVQQVGEVFANDLINK